MLFSDRPRTLYRNRPAHEVICQLRFPSILSINQMEPAEFQEDIRDAFPQYARRQDLPPIVGGQTPPPPVTNYHFLSEDGRWKLNLTKDFIALSTLYYPGWEEFASPWPLSSGITSQLIFSGLACGMSISSPAPSLVWRKPLGESCLSRLTRVLSRMKVRIPCSTGDVICL